MEVLKSSLLAIFDAKQRLEVPLFQRQYVWSEEQQWLPLWEDIERKFTEALKTFFTGEEGEGPLAADHPISSRTEECFQTLRNGLMVVVIDLQKDDDPQVIFETLNARGEPLLPADLLRNYIFFRANRQGLELEETYQKYWAPFDDDFWRKEVKQGRPYTTPQRLVDAAFSI